MNYKKRSNRIIVDVAGIPREICSFSRNNDGTINFRIRLFPEISRIGSKIRKAIKNHHISIHPSPSSEMAKIKTTAIFSDGSIHESYVKFPKNIREAAIPIILWRASTLDYHGFDHKPKHRDTVTSLGSFNPDAKTLLLLPILGNEQFQTDTIDHFCNKIEFNIDNFRLILIWTFMNAPSIPNQSFHHIVSETRVNNHTFENFSDQSYAIYQKNLLSVTENLISMARSSYFRRAVLLAEDAGLTIEKERLDWLLNTTRMLSKRGM